MKILMVSMNSIHFVRWTKQLENSGHEVFWFDILDGGRIERLPWVNQITEWKQKHKNFKGRYFFKKKLPFLYKNFSFLFEHNVEKVFEKALLEVKPDVVHSFVLYISCTPIFKVMQKHKHINWMYSSWGSDLYFYKNIPRYRQDILKVLPCIDYLITDCKRDVLIAKKLGFKGKVLGTFPGGGGFDYEKTDTYIKPLIERHSIILKGYQGRSGRAIEVLKAMTLIPEALKNYKVVVFGADEDVVKFITAQSLSKKLAITCLPKAKFLPHEHILELMGQSLIYIGNSNSDGMPNTLLEAIAMGAFPIQSNPGGASSEVITHNENGFLIEDCNDVTEIKNHILKAVTDFNLLKKAFKINQDDIKPQFERTSVKNHVMDAYQKVL